MSDRPESLTAATDAEVIAFLLRWWTDYGSTNLNPNLVHHSDGLWLFDSEYSHGPVPEPVVARLRELGYEL